MTDLFDDSGPALDALDARAMTAAARVRRQVAGFEPLDRPGGRGHRRWLIAAAVMLLAVLTTAVVVNVVGDDSRKVRTVDDNGSYFFPSPQPPGMQLDSPGRGSDELARSAASVFASPAGDHVVVVWSRRDDDPGGGPLRPAPVDLGRLHGVLRTVDGRTLFVVGTDLTPSEAAALAERIRLDATGAPIVTDKLVGLPAVGTAPVDRVLPVELFRVRERQVLTWTRLGISAPAGVAIAASPAGAADLRITELVLDDVEHQDVHGHRAVVGVDRSEGGQAQVVEWVEDGHLLQVVAGLPRPQVLTIARSVQSLTRDDYDQRIAAARRRIVLPDDGTTIATGGGSNPWRAALVREPTTGQDLHCVFRTDVDNGACAGVTGSAVIDDIDVDTHADPFVIVASTSADGPIEATTATGRSLEVGRLVRIAGRNHFAFAVPRDARTVTITAGGATRAVDLPVQVPSATTVVNGPP